MDRIIIDYKEFKKEHWTTEEERHVKLLIEFVQLLMNDHDFQAVLEKFDNSFYKQHNRGIADGMKALVRYVQNFTKRFPDYTYDVKHIHADGDIVVFHSHITTKQKDRGNDRRGINVHDTWKVKNNQIVEHWDSLQALDSFVRLYFWIGGGKVVNSNGVF